MTVPVWLQGGPHFNPCRFPDLLGFFELRPFFCYNMGV
jgi:hypothetical protein